MSLFNLLPQLLYIGARDTANRAAQAAGELQPAVQASEDEINRVAKKYNVSVSAVKTQKSMIDLQAGPRMVQKGGRDPIQKTTTSGTAAPDPEGVHYKTELTEKGGRATRELVGYTTSKTTPTRDYAASLFEKQGYTISRTPSQISATKPGINVIVAKGGHSLIARGARESGATYQPAFIYNLHKPKYKTQQALELPKYTTSSTFKKLPAKIQKSIITMETIKAGQQALDYREFSLYYEKKSIFKDIPFLSEENRQKEVQQLYSSFEKEKRAKATGIKKAYYFAEGKYKGATEFVQKQPIGFIDETTTVKEHFSTSARSWEKWADQLDEKQTLKKRPLSFRAQTKGARNVLSGVYRVTSATHKYIAEKPLQAPLLYLGAIPLGAAVTTISATSMVGQAAVVSTELIIGGYYTLGMAKAYQQAPTKQAKYSLVTESIIDVAAIGKGFKKGSSFALTKEAGAQRFLARISKEKPTIAVEQYFRETKKTASIKSDIIFQEGKRTPTKRGTTPTTDYIFKLPQKTVAVAKSLKPSKITTSSVILGETQYTTVKQGDYFLRSTTEGKITQFKVYKGDKILKTFKAKSPAQLKWTEATGFKISAQPTYGPEFRADYSRTTKTSKGISAIDTGRVQPAGFSMSMVSEQVIATTTRPAFEMSITKDYAHLTFFETQYKFTTDLVKPKPVKIMSSPSEFYIKSPAATKIIQTVKTRQNILTGYKSKLPSYKPPKPKPIPKSKGGWVIGEKGVFEYHKTKPKPIPKSKGGWTAWEKEAAIKEVTEAHKEFIKDKQITTTIKKQTQLIQKPKTTKIDLTPTKFYHEIPRTELKTGLKIFPVTTKTRAKTTTKTRAKTILDPITETRYKTISKSIVKPITKTTTKLISKTIPKTTSKTIVKTIPKTISKSIVKTIPKTITKTIPKITYKPTYKPVSIMGRPGPGPLITPRKLLIPKKPSFRPINSKKYKMFRQPKKLTPTATAVVFALRGTTTPASIKSGLGQRYINQPKKKEKRLII